MDEMDIMSAKRNRSSDNVHYVHFTTLIGLSFRPIDSIELVRRILSNTLLEGIRIVQATGCRECRIGGMPGWWLICASATLPASLPRPLFRLNLRKMAVSSMA